MIRASTGPVACRFHGICLKRRYERPLALAVSSSCFIRTLIIAACVRVYAREFVFVSDKEAQGGWGQAGK